LKIAIGITGASGSIYADKLIKALEPKVERIYVMFTKAGSQVCQHELASTPDSLLYKIVSGKASLNKDSKIKVFAPDNLFAPIASGSSAPDRMVVVPCSMGTLSRIAHGNSGNLIERSADVMMKQRKPLILVPRETPLNSIHLENMLKLSKNQVVILPPVPGFYHQPTSMEDLVDFVTGKILDSLEIGHKLYPRWNEKSI